MVHAEETIWPNIDFGSALHHFSCHFNHVRHQGADRGRRITLLIQDVYTWKEAFLLATTLCCTDIFSFIGKLKQYGTPQMLISLIEGESLFNYCTCVLIFQITN